MSVSVFSTPAGWMGIRASGNGLTDIILPEPSEADVLRQFGVESAGDGSPFSDLIRRFRAYYSGQPVEFPDRLDLAGATPFQQAVWQAARRIPYGETRSYAWVAEQAGNPKAARATGGALGKNPLPVIVPCHRVISADGSLGGFTGGLDLKRRLLDIETGH
ncbi:MAG: methylated-DNA--[protein]-cysteine S-methyltransferase [Dehalococcoidales bacterium]|nr:methylated-DNA--[protein]-cysteine S-methyltransferase [Dehalococcoidales bacterium]